MRPLTGWTPPQRRYGTLPKMRLRVMVAVKLRKHQSLTEPIWHRKSERVMAVKKHGIIVETPTEARQAERGPSVLLLLVVSTCLAVLILGAVWFVFFRT
jgi:hypothetical protein